MGNHAIKAGKDSGRKRPAGLLKNEKLVWDAKGHLHKLDGMNAFVLCNHEGPHVVQTFLVCESCSTVKELQVVAVEADIAPAVRAAAFSMHTARLEIKGNCNACAAAA